MNPMTPTSPAAAGASGAVLHVRIVTFSLDGITVEHYEDHCTRIAEAFLGWPGLLAKVWLSDPQSNRFGGVYVFESEAAADASRATEIFTAMTNNPAFADLSVVEFATLDVPTRITAAALAGARG
jgi:quinol monooxygenase YgiN